MIKSLVIVGCGEHFQKNVAPSVAAMERLGQVEVVATVDLQPLYSKLPFSKSGIPHIVRRSTQSLADCLQAYSKDKPVVLLGHWPEYHARDALDLVGSGFQVILEKPYALSMDELQSLKTIATSTTRVLALNEYYLMMKAAPLLNAAGLLKPDSFYLQEPGYCERADDPKSSPESFAGTLSSIGRPRMIYVDVLEGEGLTGRFDHRGPQFVDTRRGIGVILDLGIHALAPLVALQDSIGRLPVESEVSVRTAVCDSFLRFAMDKHNVPSQFVPETYAELSFVTSTGVPVIVSLGKYVLQNTNQRRLVIVADEGQALLDMTQCQLYVARSENCPSVVGIAPKRPESKYQAVLRASLDELAGKSPYIFNMYEVALRSNEFALALYARSRDAVGARPSYAEGAGPRTIFFETRGVNLRDPSAHSADADHSGQIPGAALYYRHQYDRMAALEDQAFKMSAGVLVLTSAVLTVAARFGVSSLIVWRAVMILIAIGNIAAIIYVWRVNDSVYIHRERAKYVLERAWPRIWLIDRRFKQRFADRVQMRPLIMVALHLFLTIAAVGVIFVEQAAVITPSSSRPPSSSVTSGTR